MDRNLRAYAASIVFILFQAIDIQPVNAGCQRISGIYGTSYFVCNMGSFMTLRGTNLRTGSTWSERCYGVGTQYGRCSGIDLRGNFWSCRWDPYRGSN